MPRTTQTRADRVVVITGGSAGVGRATAQRFAEEGARIAILARGEEALEGTRTELLSCGASDVFCLSVDVSDAEQVMQATERIERSLGPIDVWVNNAMTTVYGRIGDITPAEYRRVTDVVYHGYVWGTQAALSVMRRRNRGTIIQVGSSLAYRGIPLQAAYCGAKHAIRAFTDSLRAELIHDDVKIQLTMVQLPSVNTPQFDHALNKMDKRPQPVPPIFQPEIAADAIYFASRHRRREIYVGGSTMQLIMAQKLIPGALDHYLAAKVWDGQLTSEPARRDARSNLFAPVHTDPGAHGRFDDRARERDTLSRATTFLGAGGVRTLAIALPWIGAGLLLGRAMRARGLPSSALKRAAS